MPLLMILSAPPATQTEACLGGREMQKRVIERIKRGMSGEGTA